MGGWVVSWLVEVKRVALEKKMVTIKNGEGGDDGDDDSLLVFLCCACMRVHTSCWNHVACFYKL